MMSMVRGSNIEVDSPTSIQISSDGVADGCSLLAVTYATNKDGRYVSGFDNALRLKPGMLVDDHVIPSVSDGIIVKIVLVGLSGIVETKISDVARPTMLIGRTARAEPSDALERKMSIVGSIYQRNGIQRFRFVDQGWTNGYEAFSKTSGFDFSIPAIVSALDTYQETSTGKRKDRASANSESTKPAAARVMDLTYRAALGGTSFRKIVIVSVSGDRIRAREADGVQVKAFLVTGILELCDSETGEDILPLLRQIPGMFTH